MRKCWGLLVLLIMFFFCYPAKAEEAGEESTVKETLSEMSITTKDGFILPWHDDRVKNVLTFEVVKTKKVDSWEKWNVLYEGWSIDAGFAFDSSDLKDGAIMLGRKFGTLANYCPLDFPLIDKIDITLYPAGMYIENLFDGPEFEGCSGMAILKFEVKF